MFEFAIVIITLIAACIRDGQTVMPATRSGIYRQANVRLNEPHALARADYTQCAIQQYSMGTTHAGIVVVRNSCLLRIAL